MPLKAFDVSADSTTKFNGPCKCVPLPLIASGHGGRVECLPFITPTCRLIYHCLSAIIRSVLVNTRKYGYSPGTTFLGTQCQDHSHHFKYLIG